MVYQGDISIISFLEEMETNYSRLLDNVIFYIDGDIILSNIGGRGFRLDSRLKDAKNHKCKSKSVNSICRKYKIGYISKGEAIKSIKDTINQLEREVR